MNLLDHFSSFSFFFGLMIVFGYAVRRFDEPSFPNQETLPRTLVPLQYLFLKSAYPKARFTYVSAMLLLYVLLVAPGTKIIQALGGLGFKDLPHEAWALLVALVITGVSVAPSSLKWLNKIEELLRQWVHTWFLVPDGIKRTIGILEDADYEPPPAQLNAVAEPLRKQIQDGLRLEHASLRYRWARASMLMQSLRQMGAGTNHPLKIENFKPFQKDFEEIRKGYRALKPDIAEQLDGHISDQREEELIASVDNLLRGIYSYISWGVRYQATRQQDIDSALKNVGFRIPALGDRKGRLFDIVAPTVVLIALITIVFYLAVNSGLRAIGRFNGEIPDVVLSALMSTAAASTMYGLAVFIALKKRSAQIEQKVWRHRSPACLGPIAVTAGFVTWAVIVVTTIVLTLPTTLESLPKLASALATMSFAPSPSQADWYFLPGKMETAAPWFLAGGTVSVVLAYFLGGDVRRTNSTQRVRDAAFLGISLGLASTAAQVIQVAISSKVADPISLSLVSAPIEGLAGFLCGAIIGFMVPSACRTNLVAPPDPKTARALRNLLDEAQTALGDRTAAENWVFTPHDDLPGITPAEAVQYEGLATGVQDLLPGAGPGANAHRQFGRGFLASATPIANASRHSGHGDRRLPAVIDDGDVTTAPAPGDTSTPVEQT
jgi:hypothetical protein